jgi:hypothetical protein
MGWACRKHGEKLNAYRKIDGLTGVWRKLHVEELHNLYPSPIRTIKSRTLKWAANVALMGKNMNAYRILMGKPDGKRPLGRPRCS